MWITANLPRGRDHGASTRCPGGCITIRNRLQTDENPFAGGEWYEPWLPGGISEDFAKEAFQEILQKGRWCVMLTLDISEDI